MALTDTYSGARQTTQTQLIDAINSQRKFPVNNKLYELVAGEADFLSLIRKISKVSVDGPDKSFVEHRAPWLNNAAGYWFTGGTDFTASNIGDAINILITSVTNDGNATADFPTLKAGTIVQVVDADDPTKICNMVLKTETIDTTKTWSCYCLTEAPGFTPTVADQVYLLGSAFGENGAFTTGEYSKPQTRWFSTQIFKDAASFSRTLEKSKDIIWGSEADRLINEALANHYVKMDRTLLYGTGRQTVAASGAGTVNPFLAPIDEMVDGSGNVIRTSASFYQVMAATSNRDVSLATRMYPLTMSSLEYGDLIDTFEQLFYYGSDVKEVICGRGVVSFFNKMALGSAELQMRMAENAYGIKVFKLITPHGELNLKPTRGMTGSYNYAMAVIDPANISLAEFDPTSWYGLPKTVDGKTIEILTDAGLWVRKPETHAWVWFV